jgi:hypothetical protein
MRIIILTATLALLSCDQPPAKKANAHPRSEIRNAAIRYINMANNNHWGTFVDARDTLYMDGMLLVFDTVNLVYHKVATVTVHYKQ